MSAFDIGDHLNAIIWDYRIEDAICAAAVNALEADFSMRLYADSAMVEAIMRNKHLTMRALAPRCCPYLWRPPAPGDRYALGDWAAFSSDETFDLLMELYPGIELSSAARKERALWSTRGWWLKTCCVLSDGAAHSTPVTGLLLVVLSDRVNVCGRPESTTPHRLVGEFAAMVALFL